MIRIGQPGWCMGVGRWYLEEDRLQRWGGGAVRKHVMSKNSSLLFWMPELVHTECAVSGHRQGFLQLVPV